jgi:hypothetical protein
MVDRITGGSGGQRAKWEQPGWFVATGALSSDVVFSLFPACLSFDQPGCLGLGGNPRTMRDSESLHQLAAVCLFPKS